MTNQNDQKPVHVVSYRFPVPSKDSAARFATNRYLYEVQNVEEKPHILVTGAPSKVLRASVTLRVFREDYVGKDPKKLEAFDALTPDLDPTIRELTHGIYTSRGHELKIMVKGRGGVLEPGEMRAYIVDPAVKDGKNAFMQTFFMHQMLQAAHGDGRRDHLSHYRGAPMIGMRVGQRVVDGAGEDMVNASFNGWIFTCEPCEPIVDYEEKTAVFNSIDDIGFAVYVPLSMIRQIANLYYKHLADRWRKVIEEEHEIVSDLRKEFHGQERLKLAAGRPAPKERKAEVQQTAADQTKPKRDRKPRGSRKDTSEVKTEGETAAEAKAESSEPSSPPTAEA